MVLAPCYYWTFIIIERELINLIEHNVDVGDTAPIKQHPYRVSPMKKELLDKEVQYMLQNDIIEES